MKSFLIERVSMKSTGRFSLLLLGAVLGACGASQDGAKSKPKAEASVAPTVDLQAERDQAISGLAADLGVAVEIGSDVGPDTEFFVRYAVAALKSKASELRPRTSKLKKLRFVKNATVTFDKDNAVLNVGVIASRRDILKSLGVVFEAQEADSLQDELNVVKNRLLVAEIKDLVGDDVAKSKALYRKVEAALLGLDLRKPEVVGREWSRTSSNGLGLILADGFGVSQGTLVLRAAASESEIRAFARNALEVIQEAHPVLVTAGLRTDVRMGIQPLVLGIEEYRKALALLRSSVGTLVVTRSISAITIGGRFATSTTTDRTKPAAVLVPFDATVDAINKFVESMPRTYVEEGRAIARSLVFKQSDATKTIEIEVIETATEKELLAVQTLATGLRAVLTPELVAKHSLTKIRLGFGSAHERSYGTLTLAMPDKDTRSVADFFKTL